MKRKHLRINRFIFVIACLIFAIFAFTRILARPDPYKQYKDISNQLKTVGEQQRIDEEISETELHFLHYPELGIATADQAILAYIKQLPDVEGISFLDYESYELTDGFIGVLFHYQHFNLDHQFQNESYHGMSFAKESGELLAIQDVLRRNYTDVLSKEFKKQANLDYTDDTTFGFALREQDMILTTADAHITLPYQGNEPYLRIHSKGIAKDITPFTIKRQVPIDPNKPMIALTFDDGPSPYTDQFLQVFEQYNATASFFMLGSNIEHYPDTLKRMIENGFEICNHSWSHKSIATDDKDAILAEIFDTQDTIYRMSGHEPTRMRPPYGAVNDLSYTVANGNDVNITLWNVDTEDWRNRDAAVTLERAKAGAFDGAIILFHDLYPSSLEAVKELVPYLQGQGFQLVSVSDLFKYKGDKTGL